MTPNPTATAAISFLRIVTMGTVPASRAGDALRQPGNHEYSSTPGKLFQGFLAYTSS